MMFSFRFIFICEKWLLCVVCCLSFPNSTSFLLVFSHSQWERVDSSNLIYSSKTNSKLITFSRIPWIFAFKMFWCFVFFWNSIWMLLRFLHNYPSFVGITLSNPLLSLLLKVVCSWNFPLANFTFSCDLWEQETWLANKISKIKGFLQQRSFQVYVFFMSCLSSFFRTTVKPFVYSFDKFVNIFWIFFWFYQTTGRKGIG